MWNTAMGERTLVGAERRLVVSAGWGLADFISVAAPENKALFGIVLFDQLTWQQQMLMLERVLTALVEASIPAPPTTALLDATVAAIYAHLYTSIEIELDDAKTDLDSLLGDGARYHIKVVARRGISNFNCLNDPFSQKVQIAPTRQMPNLSINDFKE